MQGDLEASKSGAVLLTKDNNMCLKAQANGLKAVPPAHFPAAPSHLHTHLLAISSETSPVKHTPAHDASPPPSPQPLSDLSPNPSKGNITLPSASGHSSATVGQSPGVPVPSKHDQHPEINTSNSSAFVHPADRLNHMDKLKLSEQPASSLHQQQAWQADLHLQQQEQHHKQQQHHRQQQQLEDTAVGSFKLQGAPILPPGLVTGSHGYPRAPFSTPAHLQPSTNSSGQQQPDPGPGSGLDLGLQHGFAGLNGIMQHQQGGLPGNNEHLTRLHVKLCICLKCICDARPMNTKLMAS